ncbi:MAG TPA: hypothetical protein VHK24_12525 [Steroidobacter sp.]|nr:hypothetical protein [Steroidobacter sp.]
MHNQPIRFPKALAAERETLAFRSPHAGFTSSNDQPVLGFVTAG